MESKVEGVNKGGPSRFHVRIPSTGMMSPSLLPCAVNGDVLDERDLMFKAADPSELAGDADDAEQDDAEALEEAVSLARERRVNGPERLEMVISDLDGTVTWGPEAKGGREGADGEAIEVAAELDRDGGRVAGGGGGAAVEVPEGNYGAPHQDEWETNIYWGSDDDEASQAEVGGIEEEEEEESAVMERGGEEGRERQGEKAAAEELQGGGGREVCWGQWELGVLGGSGLAGDGHGAVELSSYMLRLERHQEPETTGDKEEDGEQKTKTGFRAREANLSPFLLLPVPCVSRSSLRCLLPPLSCKPSCPHTNAIWPPPCPFPCSAGPFECAVIPRPQWVPDREVSAPESRETR